MEKIFLALIPVFFAIDAIGILPLFVSMTKELSEEDKNNVIFHSMATAFILTTGFLLLGRIVFEFLGITIGDFMIAGGLILFSISILDILSPDMAYRISSKDMGVVPLGTPLIAGPAVLTSSLVILPQYGILATIISIFINILIAGSFFYFSSFFIKLFGNTGTKILSRITTLLLGALAVTMIRKGIVYIIIPGP